MAVTSTTLVRDKLSPHVDVLEREAREETRQEYIDVYVVLAALGRGDPVPSGPARRILDRAAGETR